jgi:hypothetical protein
MESSDMLDVAHYFLEEDFSASSSEQAEARSRLRTTLYESLYSKEYRYKMSNTRTQNFDFDTPVNESYNIDQNDSSPVPFNPAKSNPTAKPKGYMQPTPLNEDSPLPFGKVLDSPMN